MHVPFADLGRDHEPIASELSADFGLSLDRGDFILGDALSAFEAEFASYVGTKHCVGVASGTAALTIAVRSLGLGPGDEVIVPAHTFVASALGVLHAGATPVYCDVDESRGLLDLSSAAAVLGQRTAAILPVHLYGQACDMDAICDWARRNRLAVIEDAAQAHGARSRDRMAGSFGSASAFSFYPSKNLGALGDGGAICTNDPAVAEAARQLRNLGQRTKGVHESAGFNERLDTMQAAFLRTKLPHLDRWNGRRRALAGEYSERLPEAVRTLPADPGCVFHLFPVRVEGRDQLAEALRAQGVATGIHYSPTVPSQPAFADAGGAGFPVADSWAAEELSLPMFPGLTEAELDHVCEAVEAAMRQPGRDQS